jgi:mannose-1-phosphate guanylyltransferase
VIHDPEIRGTAGGVAGARPLLEGSEVLVWNGDILTRPPVNELLARAKSGSMVLAVAPRAAGFGSAGLDEAGHVVRLRGERFGHEASGGDYIGVAALGGRALAALPPRGCLIGDVALPLLRAGERIESVPHAGEWCDVGAFDGYVRANLEWLDRRGLESWFGEGASAPAARVTRSLIGERARIDGNGPVERCIVWPDALVRAPLSDAIVTPRSLVRLGSGRQELD